VLLVTHGSPAEVADAFQRQTAAGAWKGLGDHARVLDPVYFADNPGLAMPAAARHLVDAAAEATREAGGVRALRADAATDDDAHGDASTASGGHAR
jgi:hypothetical protein